MATSLETKLHMKKTPTRRKQGYEEILYALHIMQCKTNGPLHQMYVAPLAEIISKICGNVLQDLWEFGREKKSPRFVGIISKICGNVGEKKKSPRFVGEIF